MGVLTAVLTASPAVSRAATTISAPEHPVAVYHEFSGPDLPFAPYTPPGGVASGARLTIQNGALQLRNAHPGSFAVDLKVKPFDAIKFGDVFFNYRLSSDVKVNLFFKVKGIYHGAIFTGPSRVRPGSIMMGTIAGVKTDGTWNRAHIPLRTWLRNLYPTDTQISVEEVIVGNWDNSGYLLAGFGGNPAGATWWLDNFAIAGVGPSPVKLNIDGAPTNASFSLDGTAVRALTGSSLQLSPSDGPHRIEVRGPNGAVASAVFVSSSSGPIAGAPTLAADGVRWPLTSAAGLAPGLRLEAEGKTFDLASPHLTWNGQVLHFDAARAGFVWKDGQEVPLVLDGLADTLGRTTTRREATVPIDYNVLKSAPLLPEATIEGDAGTLQVDTFEDGVAPWEPREGRNDAAIVERDEGNARSGVASLRLTVPGIAVAGGAWIRRTGFDAGKFPVIRFDYRATPQYRGDFLLSAAGEAFSIGFTDTTPGTKRLGAIANVKADGSWQTAEIPLLDWLRAANPRLASYKIDWLAIGDTGWQGNARGAQVWFDNFAFVPVVRSNSQLNVALRDLSGTKNVSWVLDTDPATVPPATPAANQQIRLQGTGLRWIHLRAQNGTGQWSNVRHLPLRLDSEPPQIGESSPKNGSSAAPTELTIPLRDDIGIDPSSIRLEVGGRPYLTNQSALTMENSQLRFNLEMAIRTGTLTPLADGARLSWKLAPVRDLTGQESPAAEGHFLVDFRQDTKGPELTGNSTSHPATRLALWESGEEAPPVSDGLTSEAINTPDGRAQKFTVKPAGEVLIRLTRVANFEQQPVIVFAYKFDARQHLGLRMRFNNGRLWHIKLVGDIPDTIGTASNIVADGTWRIAQINLREFIQRDQRLAEGRVSSLEFVDPSRRTPVGTSFEIGRLAALRPGPASARFQWRAADLSGISAFRWGWSQNAADVPTEELPATTTNKIAEGAPGLWFAHLQARDGAGNWGPISHLPVLIDK